MGSSLMNMRGLFQVKVTLWPTVSRPVSLGSNPHLGPNIRFMLLSDSCGFVSVSQLVNLLLAFTSTVFPGFSLLEIRDQDFCSFLDVYMFGNLISSLTREGSVFLCRHFTFGPHYIVSAQTTQKTPLPSVATGACLLSRCLAMVVSSCSALLAFSPHVTWLTP
jgi:hypothetical protein